jgi:FkbM family methyltransferase
MVVKAHTSIIGETGYNCHSRNFFKELDKLVQVQVRNWTVGSSWRGYNNDEPHNNEYYIDDQLKRMLVEQTLTTPSGDGESFPLYERYKNTGTPNVHIVLNDNLHHYFNEDYDGIKIAYNAWETTRQPDRFFEQLKRFDQVWVPSEWQRQCTIEQGISSEKVKVVPEGVDTETYRPISRVISNPVGRPFRFVLVGRWDYRKSIREIIETFTKTFSEGEDVELVINVDNSFANDGLKTTEERLQRYGLSHSKIRVLHHLSKDEYVSLLRSADVFVSCARGEGWNLPLIEAMACGVPSIYSDWGGQLQFANGRGIPVKVKGEVPAAIKDGDGTWINDATGNFAEPDFEDLSRKMLDVRKNFKSYKKKALDESDEIRNEFTWKNAAHIAKQILDELVETKTTTLSEKIGGFDNDFAYTTCGNIGYMPLIETMVQSLLKFSTRKVIVYGINCDVPFDYPNVIKRRINIETYSEHDKWYWKQWSCIESLSEGFQNYIWIDGDVVANYNIDTLSNHFGELTNYPIPDVHIQEEFFGQYPEPNGETGSQLFNQRLHEKFGFGKRNPIAHVCLYIYNQHCKWWFEEIIRVYRETPLPEYKKFLLWNDEGADNFLRAKNGCDRYLPLSKLDVSGYVYENETHEDSPKHHFLTFWNESGPKNFNKIYGWAYIPKEKENIRYFHGNKDIEFAKFMIEFIKLQRDKSFYDSYWFYVGKNEVKNLGEIEGVEGSTMEIAGKWGWDYAIYHEVFNLKDYERFGNVGVKNGDVVVDLGGNIGIFTRYAYQCGASKVVTFEPDRRYFEVLRKNAPKGVVLFNAAIGDKLGTMQLTESEHLGGSNLWTPKNNYYTQYDVQTYTLDYLFKTGLVDKIDFLKVDVEGSEIIALKGISDENLRRVRNIVVEYHHEHLRFDEELRETFIQRLVRLGFNSHLLFCGTNNALQLIYFWR